jgi:hypothetical protein
MVKAILVDTIISACMLNLWNQEELFGTLVKQEKLRRKCGDDPYWASTKNCLELN